MDRTQFLKALGSRLYPILRSEGFRGSGSTLRRIDIPVIHVFNVQGSTSGDRCYLNLGAHLTFLPSDGGVDVPTGRYHEYDCAFRSRISPRRASDFGWCYGTSATDADETIDAICDSWLSEGHAFFDRFASYPSSFVTLLNGKIRESPHPSECLTLARIAIDLALPDMAVSFAQLGLADCPESAFILRRRLEQLAAS